MKIIVDEFNTRLWPTEERVGILEDRSIGIIQYEEEKEDKKNSFSDLRDNIKRSNICVTRVPEEER